MQQPTMSWQKAADRAIAFHSADAVLRALHGVRGASMETGAAPAEIARQRGSQPQCLREDQTQPCIVGTSYCPTPAEPMQPTPVGARDCQQQPRWASGSDVHTGPPGSMRAAQCVREAAAPSIGPVSEMSGQANAVATKARQEGKGAVCMGQTRSHIACPAAEYPKYNVCESQSQGAEVRVGMRLRDAAQPGNPPTASSGRRSEEYTELCVPTYRSRTCGTQTKPLNACENKPVASGAGQGGKHLPKYMCTCTQCIPGCCATPKSNLCTAAYAGHAS